MTRRVKVKDKIDIRGEGHPNSKLTKEKVIDIRKKVLFGKETQIAMSLKYGVSKSLINKIVKGKRWQHVK